MRLCTIQRDGKAAVGVKMGDGKIIDLSKQMPRGPKSVVEILAGGKKVQDQVAQGLRQAQGRRHGVGEVGQVPGADSRARQDHLHRPQLPQACRRDRSPIPPYPVVFCRFNNTLLPHNGKMPRPNSPMQLDWEAELAMIIGQEVPQRAKEKSLR